jgi:hypothetical protein
MIDARLTSIFVKAVLAFYKKRMGKRSAGGAVISVRPFGHHDARQRTSSRIEAAQRHHFYVLFDI